METIRDAYAGCWAARRDFLMLAFLPVLAMALLLPLEQALQGPATGAEPANRVPAPLPVRPVDIVALVVTLVFYVMFAVAWHRRFLLAGESPTVWGALRWGGRQTRFLLRFLAMSLAGSLVGAAGIVLALLITEAIGIAGGGLGLVTMAAVLVATVAALCRLLPLLPAAAVDAPLGVRACWRLTGGNTLQMVLIGLIPAVPLVLLALLAAVVYGSLAAAVGLLPTLTGVFVGALIVQAFNYAGIAVTVTALSFAYRHLTDPAWHGGAS